MGERLQQPILSSEQRLRSFSILDVRIRAIPRLDRADFVSDWHGADQKPAVCIVEPPHPRFSLVRLSGCQYAPPRLPILKSDVGASYSLTPLAACPVLICCGESARSYSHLATAPIPQQRRAETWPSALKNLRDSGFDRTRRRTSPTWCSPTRHVGDGVAGRQPGERVRGNVHVGVAA